MARCITCGTDFFVPVGVPNIYCQSCIDLMLFEARRDFLNRVAAILSKAPTDGTVVMSLCAERTEFLRVKGGD